MPLVTARSFSQILSCAPLFVSFAVFSVVLCALPQRAGASVIVADVTTTNVAAGTTHNITMPAMVNAGDLLIAIATFGDFPSGSLNTPAGWTRTWATQVAGDMWGAAFVKDAIGDEDGTTVNFSTSQSNEVTFQVFRITANSWYGNITTGIATGTAVTGDTTTPFIVNRHAILTPCRG